MYIPDPSNSANGPGAGAQSLSEVNGAPTNSQIHPPSESSYPQDFHEPSQNENRRGGRDAGRRKERSRSATNNHHSKHRHRSADKKSKSKSKSGKSGSSNWFKKKDKKKSSGGNSHSHSHGHSRGHHHRSTHHHSSSHHRRHRSPDKHRRARSAENTLDSRHGGGRGRSPARHHAQQHHRHHHSSPRRHRSPHRGRSPYRSPHRSPYRRSSPHRHGSPHRSRYQSPNRYRSRSVDPYADRVANTKPEKEEEVALKEPPPPMPPSRSESVLTEAAALDRLNRGDTLHRDASSLLRDPSPSAERSSFLKDPGMRDAIERAYREAVERERDRETQTLPRARTPNSSAAYNRYSSLLRGRSPEREDRLESPSARYRTRSLGRDLSPERTYVYEDEDEDEEEYEQPDYYRVPRPTYDRVSNTLPEPRSRHYKDNPRDLSI